MLSHPGTINSQQRRVNSGCCTGNKIANTTSITQSQDKWRIHQDTGCIGRRQSLSSSIHPRRSSSWWGRCRWSNLHHRNNTCYLFRNIRLYTKHKIHQSQPQGSHHLKYTFPSTKRSNIQVRQCNRCMLVQFHSIGHNIQSIGRRCRWLEDIGCIGLDRVCTRSRMSCMYFL